MPRIENTPESLRPYLFHGVHLDWGKGPDAIGECPFCGKEGKFSVNLETSQFKCWRCLIGEGDSEGGNKTTFIRLLHAESFESTPLSEYRSLIDDRKLLFEKTPRDWGVCRSLITKNWIIPGYGADGKIKTLYSYGDVLYPTPTLGSQLFCAKGLEGLRKCSTVYICEGPWDGMALYECLQNSEEEGIVVAVPGCGCVGVPMTRWATICSGKTVVLCFDHDHSKQRNGKQISGAGLEATKRATAILTHLRVPPKELGWLQWSGELPDGYDIRDHLSKT